MYLQSNLLHKPPLNYPVNGTEFILFPNSGFPHHGDGYRAGAMVFNADTDVIMESNLRADSAISVVFGAPQALQINLQCRCDIRTLLVAH